eukprot:scaffold5708_cov107-Isochrysis_galbana.AAC.13
MQRGCLESLALADGSQQLVELLEFQEALLGGLLGGGDSVPLRLGVTHLVNRLRPLAQRLHRAVDKALDRLLMAERRAADAEQQRIRETLVLILERRLEGQQVDGDAVDLLGVGQLLGLLALLLEHLKVGLEVRCLGEPLLDEVVHCVPVLAEEHPRPVTVGHRLELGEEFGGALHLVLARAAVLEVTQPLEAGRDGDELADLAVKVRAQLLDRRAELEPARLELELALDVRQV